MKKNNYRLIFKIIIACLCTSFAIKNFLSYREATAVIANTKPVPYKFIEDITHRGGRGTHYDIVIWFNGEEYTLDSTSGMIRDLKNGRQVPLYYNDRKDEVISEWDKTLSLRLTLLSLAAFTVIVVSARPRKKK